MAQMSTKITNSSPSAFPTRYVFAILGFIGMFCVYTTRINLSVTLRYMVDGTDSKLVSGAACPRLASVLPNLTLDSERQDKFKWDTEMQSYILGAFFYGYVVTQIPGGVAVQRFGAKWFLALAVLGSSICSFLIPLAAKSGAAFLIAVRVIQGLVEGAIFPAISSMISVWVPKRERSRITTLINIGSSMGMIMALAAPAYFIESNILGGWPLPFYLMGCCGCIWFVFWVFLIYDRPEDHPRISADELLYIKQNKTNETKAEIPWTSILKSLRVWALVFSHFGQNWGLNMFLMELPNYFSNVLHFELKENGVLSALPHVLQMILASLGSIAADKMGKRKWFNNTTIRKIFNSIGFFGPSICILLIVFAGCRRVCIVTLLCLAMGMNGFAISGFFATHTDLSPEFSGTLMSITNCFANLTGILVPLVTGKFIEKGETLYNWNAIFVITSAVYFFTGFVYVLFASAELKPWGVSDEKYSKTTINAEKSKEVQTPTSRTVPNYCSFTSK